MADTWERVSVTAACGRCGKFLEQGDPVLVKTLPGLKRKLRRCEDCAGPAPPNLPDPIMLSQTTKRMQSISKRATAARTEWTPYRDSE